MNRIRDDQGLFGGGKEDDYLSTDQQVVQDSMVTALGWTVGLYCVLRTP